MPRTDPTLPFSSATYKSRKMNQKMKGKYKRKRKKSENNARS